MGAHSSSLSELANNEYLVKLSGTESIPRDDPFWDQLLSFSFRPPVNSSDHRLLEESTLSICKNFAINNCKTGNLNVLIQVFLARVDELKTSAKCEDSVFTWQTFNALFIIRSICKYFVESLSEEVVVQQFETKPTNDGTEVTESEVTGSLLEELIKCLMEVLVDVDVMNNTYALHLEALNTLIVIMSLQMFQPKATSDSTVYRYVMQGKCSIHACVLMKALLHNFIQQEKCPPEMKAGGGGGVLYNATAAVASGLWTVMTLGLAKNSKPPVEEESDTLLANQSLLFTLILANHCTSDKGLHNPYRQALFSFTNSQDQGPTSPTAPVATFKMDFTKLYQTLCKTMTDDQTTLLLYLLLHRNANVKTFLLSRTNIDMLIMPILRILYNAQEKNSHHIYMALIILLILTEDDFFNKAVHETKLTNVLWFKERTISEITLGGLLVLVVIRTIQFNMCRMRDKYLHTNCLAALANMSSQFHSLHPYVTQRIVSLFAQLSKKHTRLVEQIRTSALVLNHESDSENETETDCVQDLAVLEEVIRMVLEIVNSSLTHSMQHNPNLIYTLLYQKELFMHFRTHPAFQDIIQNIDTVLSFFSSRLENHDKNISVSEVLEVIKQGAVTFRKDKLKKFPELKFRYVEEDQPEEFFIPYVWSLVFHASQLYFNPTRIQLFSLQTT